MADHPIPDDLLKRMYVATGHGADGAPVVPRRYVDAVLAALAEWADGALVVPNGWRQTRLVEVDGVEMCTAHDEPHIEGHDTPRACLADCTNCEGDGGLDTGDDAEPYVDCPICGGSGLDNCTLVPLYTLTLEDR